MLAAVEEHLIPRPQHRYPPGPHPASPAGTSVNGPSGTRQIRHQIMTPQQMKQHRQHRDRVTSRLGPPISGPGAANTRRSAAPAASWQ
jgi:hypothetical protein